MLISSPPSCLWEGSEIISSWCPLIRPIWTSEELGVELPEWGEELQAVAVLKVVELVDFLLGAQLTTGVFLESQLQLSLLSC